MILDVFLEQLNTWFPGLVQRHSNGQEFIVNRYPIEEPKILGNYDVDFQQEAQADASFRALRQTFKALDIYYQHIYEEGAYPSLHFRLADIAPLLTDESLFLGFKARFAQQLKTIEQKVQPIIPEYTDETKSIEIGEREWMRAKRFFFEKPTESKFSITKGSGKLSFLFVNKTLYAKGKLLAEGNVGTKIKWLKTETGLIRVVKRQLAKFDRRILAQTGMMRKVHLLFGMMQRISKKPWKRKTAGGITIKGNTKLYSILPYLPGSSLIEYFVGNEKKLTNKEILLILLGCCEIVYGLQQKRLIHCDLKPDNFNILFLDGDVKFFLSDFEWLIKISKNRDAIITKSVGTLGFIAPEVLKEGIYSNKSEIYALGEFLARSVGGNLNPKLEEWDEWRPLFQAMMNPVVDNRPTLTAVIGILIELGEKYGALKSKNIERFRQLLSSPAPDILSLTSTVTFTPHKALRDQVQMQAQLPSKVGGPVRKCSM